MSPSSPLVLSPSLPSELLAYILDHHAHPTTLVICSSRSEFLRRYSNEVKEPPETTQQPTLNSQVNEAVGHGAPRSVQAVNTMPIAHVAVARHIRTIYVPTVTHLRAYLSVFSNGDSRVPAPPPTFKVLGKQPPHLIIYGLLDLHRDTSEWSAQGLGDTLSTLVETGHRLQLQVNVIEPKELNGSSVGALEEILEERLPLLNSIFSSGLDSEEGAWSGRSIEVGRVFGRWFQFKRGAWRVDEPSCEGEPEPQMDTEPCERS